jgi:ribosomal protein S18 acetylase RimI-like enzyme
MEWTLEDYNVTDERAATDLDAVCDLLRDTYWASGRSRTQTALSLDHSICFNLLHHGVQIGLARVLTDYGASSYICDVIIHANHRGRGLGKWLMSCVLQHPALVGTRVFLITRDAQLLYRQLGFVTHPFECMVRPDTAVPTSGVSSRAT